MSNTNAAEPQGNYIVFNGLHFHCCNLADQVYTVHAIKHGEQLHDALVDGGNNGGIAGENCLVIDETFSRVDVHGIGDAVIPDVPIGTVASLITTSSGPIIGYFHQYALYGRGKTLHSSLQLRSFGNKVDDCPKSLGGTQCVITHDGYNIPLSICEGLPYMDMTKPTLEDIARYPHVTFTADNYWDPRIADNEVFHDPLEPDDYDAYPDQCYLDTLDGEIGAYHSKISETSDTRTEVHREPRSVLPKKPDFEALRPYFNWISIERIQETLANTTQFFRAARQNCMKRHW